MPDILVTDDGPIRTIRMNRPEKKNALTLAMYGAMADAIEGAGGETRCLLIAGCANAFCAGNDIGDFMQMATPERRTGRADPALPACAGALREAAGRRRAGQRGRRRHHHAAALRLCGRGDRRAAGNAVRRARPGAGGGLQPARAAADGPRPRLRAAGDGRAALGGGGARGRHRQCRGAGGRGRRARLAGRGRAIAALPPRGRAHLARRLMRGSPDEIVARIDAEADAFKARLRSPEAQAAFAAFLARKR